MTHDLANTAASLDIKQDGLRGDARAADARPAAHDFRVAGHFDDARLTRRAEHGGHLSDITATPPIDESGAAPRRATGTVFKDDTSRGEFIADAVGFGEVFSGAGGGAGGDSHFGIRLLLRR